MVQVISLVDCESFHPFPPHALEAAVPEVVTPAPRTSPLTVRLASAEVGGNGETPKFVCPAGFQCASCAWMNVVRKMHISANPKGLIKSKNLIGRLCSIVTLFELDEFVIVYRTS